MTKSASPPPDIPLSPPVAAKRPVVIEQHGRSRVDDYAWLRAQNWREVMRDPSTLDADIRAHLEAENAYSAAWLADVAGLRETLFCEMRGRIKEDDESTPDRDGAYWYWSRYRMGGQYPIFLRRAAAPLTFEPVGPEEIVFDGDKEAEGSEYFELGGLAHSPNHRLLAYAVDRTGSEVFTLRVRDLATGEDLPDVIEDTTGDFEWANDSATLLWVWRDAEHRPAKVFRHRLGQTGADALVYEESDPGFFVSVGKTESERYLVVDAHDHVTSEVRLIPADDPAAEPLLVAARETGVEYDVSDCGDRVYVLTNLEGAIDFKLMTAPLASPGRAHWREWIGHREGVLVLGQRLFSGHHVRLEREAGLPRIVVRRLADDAEHAIAFNEEAYSLGLAGTYAFDTTTMRFGYASPTTPDQLFAYDMESRTRTLLKTRQVPSGHAPSDYVARRILAPARDGESVPVTILHHHRTPIDGSAPLLLYGYGAYGITDAADFRTARLSLVDRGFVFAIAHVRGSMAKGYRWYLDGKRDKKTNTFTDYLDAAEALIGHGYSARGRVAAMGGSAGGLLVGAALNMDPGLFVSAVAAVPFVDVLNTISDASLPLTPPEWPEWGNPVEEASVHDLIASYAPYENIVAQAYPPIFALAGLADSRVTYWEAAKWIARLRATASGGPFLLKINMEAGHRGASGRWDALKETALEFAFALKTAGLAEQAPFARGAPGAESRG